MDGSTFLASLASSSGGAAAAKSPADVKASALIQFNSGILDSLPVQPGVKSITLIPSPSGDPTDDSPGAASSKVHTRNVVNFAWDHDYYPGQVVSVSPVGGADFLAYGIVAPGKSEGVVRVVQRKTEQRTLLKGMRGKIKDLAFAHTKNKVILGCVDEFSNIFVFSVSEDPSDSSLSHELLLEVSADGKDVTDSDYQRFIWCPYLPEDGSEEDEDEPDCPARQFVVTCGPVAEIWNLDMVTSQFGDRISRAQTKKDDFVGMMSIADHEEAISDAAFSPDGTALATASLDGQVKFFQCYLIGGAAEQNPPRCLHKWSPHGGKPVSFIHFLDNHKVHNPEVQFWKFAVTGANFNSELKLWSCETWSCLQTIRFQPLEGRKAVFKVAMDLTSSFLVLSEINSKHVYIIHLNEGHEKAAVSSVSEFATPSSFLSLSVVDAGIQRVKDEHQNYEDSNRGGSEEEYDILEMEDELMENNSSKKLRKSEREATVVEMMIVQPKSLQHCRIVFDDAARLPAVIKREDVFPAEALQDELSAAAKNIKLEPVSPKVEMVTPPDVKPKLSRLSRDGGGGVDPLSTSDLDVAAQSITLMSPDSFSVRPNNGKGAAAAAAAKQPVTLPPIKIKDEIIDATDSFNATAAAGDLSKDSDKSSEARAARLVTRSGQSSPSREVQDILCENEAIGGLGTEVIITEDDDYVDDQADTEVEDDDEDEDDDDEDDEDDEEVAADFKNLDRSAAARRSLEQQQRSHHPPDASTLSNPGEDWTTKKIKPEPLEVPSPGGTAAAGATAAAVLGSAELGVLLHKMDELGRLVASQRSEIQVLRKEIMEGRRSDRQKVEQLVRQAGQSTNSAIKQERKNVGDAVAASLGRTVSAKVEAGVASEMKRVAPAIVQSAMASVAHAVERDMQARVGKVDAQMRDAVARCMQSKALSDSIAAAVGAGLQASMQSAFRDSLTGTLIPAFERAVQNMFVQLSTTFTRGMKEHEALIKRSAEPVVRELQRVASASSKTMHSNSDLVSSIRKSVVEEVGNALEQHARSLAATPQVEGSPGGAAAANAARNTFEDNQRSVRSHLSRGDFDAAFQTALNANSLPLVVNTCEMANPSQIFTPPCLLSQHVILALIQQLGHNLVDHTETKHRFLEESIMNLDSQNPSTRHHMGAILGGLQKQLQAYIKEHPNNKFTKQMKMLLMATQSLLTTD